MIRTITPSARLGNDAPLGVGLGCIRLPRSPLIQSNVAAAPLCLVGACSRPPTGRDLGQVHSRRPRAADVMVDHGILSQIARRRGRQPFAEAPQDVAGGL